jgi:4'-phosphopantetheinyl transferase
MSDKDKRANNLSLCGRVLLGYILKNYYGKEYFCYRYGENGKPYLENEDIFFNISHSGSVALCTVGRSENGCDIQQHRPYNEKVAKRFFTEQEFLLISRSEDKEKTFTRLWTMKEAVLKKKGTGISGGLSTYDFSEYAFCDDFSVYGCRFSCFEYGDYEICICSDSLKETVETVTADEFEKYIDSIKI